MNHVWQSTLFAGLAAVLTPAFRENRAQVRYWLWFSASLKFLLPFVLLTMIGRHLEWVPATPKIAPPSVSRTVTQVNEPFINVAFIDVAEPGSERGPLHRAPLALFGVWACGFAAIALIRWRAWRRVRAVVRAGVPLDLTAPVPVQSAAGLLEPGVVGLFRPVLLLPADIRERLSPSQLQAVLAHELCHVRRRDNLTAAIHMLVEAVFWFHPLIWWIGARLVEERERACDEEVLRLGNASQEYAEAILRVCKSYLEPPLKCVTAVTGSDLRKRIQAILSGCVAVELSAAKKIALAGVAIVVLATPVLIGTLGRVLSAPLPGKPSGGAAQAAQRATPAQPEPSLAYISALGRVAAKSVTVKPRIAGQLLSLNFKEGDRVRAGQLLATIDARRFQIDLERAEAQLAQDLAMLAQATGEASVNPNDRSRIEQFEAAVKNDQIQAQGASLQMAYTQVLSPISGVAGLRSVDPGNLVDPGTTLVVINQLQPTSVVFGVAEDQLPRVLLAWDAQGYNLPVEAWDRSGSKRLATGRLAAVDNQADQTQGTVKLKAVFDNKDGALFPNQFVMVRLFLMAR